MSLTVTTKSKPIVDMQKIMRKESKHCTTENIQTTQKKEENGRNRKELQKARK